MSEAMIPNFTEAIRRAIEARVSKVHTALPGSILAYDNTTQTADVQLQIKSVLRDEDDGTQLVESMPVLSGIPIAFPRANSFFLSFPVAVGDSVLVVFCEASIDRWRSQDQEVDPVDLTRHDLQGALAIPCLYPSPRALTETSAANLVIGKQGGMQINIDPSGNAILGAVGATTQPVGLADDILSELQSAQSDIQAVLNALNTFITAYNAHTHVSAGPGNPTAPPAAPATPGSISWTPAEVGSSKVQAEE